MPHPGIGLLLKVRMDWVSDGDLLTTIPIVPQNEAPVRMVRTMRSGPAEVVGTVQVLKDQSMSDPGKPKGGVGARRNPRKSPQKRRFQRVQRQ